MVKKSIIMPVGIIILMVWQLLIVIYSFVRVVGLIDVASIGGTEFGISDPKRLMLFYIIVLLVNLISLAGMYQRYNWVRWMYILLLLIVILFRISQWILFKTFLISNEWMVICINLIIMYYLLAGKRAKTYFQAG